MDLEAVFRADHPDLVVLDHFPQPDWPTTIELLLTPLPSPNRTRQDDECSAFHAHAHGERVVEIS